MFWIEVHHFNLLVARRAYKDGIDDSVKIINVDEATTTGKKQEEQDMET